MGPQNVCYEFQKLAHKILMSDCPIFFVRSSNLKRHFDQDHIAFIDLQQSL